VVSLTISLGVASWPAHGTTVDDVVRAADTALYAAKHGGRDRVALPPIREGKTAQPVLAEPATGAE
jgi:PleD family two-component response regulator